MKSVNSLYLLDYPGVHGVLAIGLMVLGWMLSPQVAATELPAPQHVSKQIRCPVCGMYPSRYPQWRVQLIHADRSMRAFDSPADLLRYLENRARFEKAASGAGPLPKVAAIYVTDFSQGGWLEIRQAWVVRGSRLRGPMNGPDYPAFATEAAAQRLVTEQGGEVQRFTALIAPEFLDELALKAVGQSAGGQAGEATKLDLPHSHDGHDHH